MQITTPFGSTTATLNPVKARRTSPGAPWPNWADAFLAFLRIIPNVTTAAASVGISTKTVYEWRRTNGAFEDAVLEALNAWLAVVVDKLQATGDVAVAATVAHVSVPTVKRRRKSDADFDRACSVAHTEYWATEPVHRHSDVSLRNFQEWCALNDEVGDWVTTWAAAVAHRMLAHEPPLWPAEYARRWVADHPGTTFDNVRQNLTGWFVEGHVPTVRTAREVEAFLGLIPGTLVAHTDTPATEKRRKDAERYWHENARDFDGGKSGVPFKEAVAAGEFSGGVPFRERVGSVSRRGETQGPRTLQAVAHQALLALLRIGPVFEDCEHCGRPLIHSPTTGGSGLHPECMYAYRKEHGWNEKVTIKPRRGRSSERQMLTLLQVKGLRRSVRATSVNLTFEKRAATHHRSRTRKTISTDKLLDRALERVKGMTWGSLIKASRFGPDSIHNVLADVSVMDFLAISRGEHVLCQERDRGAVERYLRKFSVV